MVHEGYRWRYADAYRCQGGGGKREGISRELRPSQPNASRMYGRRRGRGTYAGYQIYQVAGGREAIRRELLRGSRGKIPN